MSPIRVLIADDQRAYREGLARAISAREELELVAVARDGEEALDAVETLMPDIALVDLRMSGMGGTTFCRELRRRHPSLATSVILMSAQDGAVVSEHAARSGADGFVSKDRSRREICETLIAASRRPRRQPALAPAEAR